MADLGEAAELVLETVDGLRVDVTQPLQRDGFFTLARLPEGVTCFFVPRSLADGRRNTFLIQRLKDKVGNRSNASSEIEYRDTWAELVGERGRGIETILSMAHHTRFDIVVGVAGMMRAALNHAMHHARHRSAFGKELAGHPLMANVSWRTA